MSKPPQRRTRRGPGAEADVFETARGKAIDVLSECFAQDNMTLEDFERRVSLAHQAHTKAELESVLEGLPVGAWAKRDRRSPGRVSTVSLPAGVRPARVRRTDRAVAVFGESKRVGSWIPARETTVVAVVGSVVIDLREALLGDGEFTFKVLTVLGSVEVIVPPGLRVECAGSAIVGSFDHRPDTHFKAEEDAPSVRIDGLSVLGSVEVEFRQLGESKRDARRRRRFEKKERKRDRKRGRLRSGG